MPPSTSLRTFSCQDYHPHLLAPALDATLPGDARFGGLVAFSRVSFLGSAGPAANEIRAGHHPHGLTIPETLLATADEVIQ
jgi:hypothetical protein